VAHIENWLPNSMTHTSQAVQEVQDTAPGEDSLAAQVDEFSGTSSLSGVQKKQDRKREEQHWELQEQEEHLVQNYCWRSKIQGTLSWRL